MLDKMAPKRTDKLVPRHTITEEMSLIEGTDNAYVTPSGDVWCDYGNDMYLKRKPYLNPWNGYLYITVRTVDHKDKSYRLHKLVAKAFVENDDPETKTIVGHKDNNKANPVASNLYWTTWAENIQKAHADGLCEQDSGYEDSQSKPVIAFDEAGNEIGRYGSVCQAHRALGVSKSTIIRWCEHEIKGKPRKGMTFQYQSAPLTTIESTSGTEKSS